MLSLTPLDFVIAALAVYRLTLMLNSEEGPAHIFSRLRTAIGVTYDQYSNAQGKNWVAEGVLCFFCLSVWIAFGVFAVFILAPQASWIFIPFALSGGAVYLKKAVG